MKNFIQQVESQMLKNDNFQRLVQQLHWSLDIFRLPRPEDHHRSKHFNRVTACASSPPRNASFFMFLLRGSEKGGLG